MEGLKRKRKEAGHTLKAVGLMVSPKLSAKTIFNYENGTREPNLSTLKQLAELFKCPIEELL